MGIVVLLIVAYGMWKLFNINTQPYHDQENAEFEHINQSLKDVDDDFNVL